MKIYVFGNEDVASDGAAFAVMRRLTGKIEGVEFVPVKPNEDLPFAGEPEVIIVDTVQGIDDITIMGSKDLDRLVMPPTVSVHDFDLGFQLKLLMKLGKLAKVTIVGLPQSGSFDYERIQSILRKLVEQDMQGS